MQKSTLTEKGKNKSVEPELTIITTHVNADFDAVASLLAAQKLYPDALVVFPGSQEKNLRNFFIQSMVYLFNLAEIKEIDLKKVKKLVLVDTRRADRIGKLAQVLQNPGLKIHIYDHHPEQKDDIEGDRIIQRLTGATATILTGIIRRKKIDLMPEEATIMCLGIYEDTGSFTFSSTTAEDFEAAAFLVSKGANINIIADMIAREISPEQISHLNDLIQSAITHTINGIDVVVTSITLDHYLPDFAFLIHKIMKMEDINAIFALGMMENKVYVVARSKTADVDAGSILSAIGGGGHASAASASLKGKTLAQVEQLLFKEMGNQIKIRRQARHLMSSPAITIGETVRCKEANNLLTRYNINAILVTGIEKKTDKLIGYITRQITEKAIFHELGDAPVKDYMSTEIASVRPDADLAEIQDKIITNKQRILPVVDDNQILGVITRTDLLNTLVHQTSLTRNDVPNPFESSLQARTRNINNFMQERFPKNLLEILQEAGRTAESLAFESYVVGGFVRDLFLYRTNEDVDIVIEGDGIAFAKALARKYGARVHAHRKFGTAVVIFKDTFKIDVATARMEYYRSPAALPDVEMSSIKLDLFRRDFTINTLAIHLNPNKFGRLIDFFSAQRDIKDKAIRVLHNLSFVEDPTRVFRAIRFEQRFGFAIGKLTSSLIENAVKMDFFKKLSGRRVFAEIRQILEEENPTPAIVRMQDYGLLNVIHDSITLNKEMIDLLNAARSAIAWHDLLFIEEPYLRWMVYFMVLTRHCGMSVSHDICAKLELPPRFSDILCEGRREAQHQLQQLEQGFSGSNSQLYHALSGFRTELILYLMAITRNKTAKKHISVYYNQLRGIKPLIGGQDLKSLGLKPGPLFRQILNAVLDQKLNGRVQTRQDELTFVHRWIQTHPPENFT